MNDKLSLVIPTYNEKKNIESLCTRLSDILRGHYCQFEIIIVDDDSPDGTFRLAQSLAERNKSIKVINRIGKKDLSTAVVAGWCLAEGDILGVIDADFQHPPEILLSMIKEISSDKEVDIVIASRNVKGGGVSQYNIWRRLVSRTGIFISRILLPKTLAKVKDPMSGFFILRKTVIKDKVLSPTGYKILIEVLAKGNYNKILEVPYIFQERKEGGSKLNLKEYIKFLIHICKLSFQTKEIFYLIGYVTIVLFAIAAFYFYLNNATHTIIR